MKKIIHRADNRGTTINSWLDSKHNFSFASYSDRDRVHFGALRVLNDDIVQAGKGFGKHPHDNMEIISIPIKGQLAHRDSMNHEQTIKENEVQVMSAGTGLFHSEYNASETESVNFLQIWIYPEMKNVEPVYDQKYFDPKLALNKWQFLVSGFTDNNTSKPLHINQQALISRIFLTKNNNINYTLNRTSLGSFLFIVSGKVEIADEKLSKRDAIGLSECEEFALKATEDSYILNIEVPEINFK